MPRAAALLAPLALVLGLAQPAAAWSYALDAARTADGHDLRLVHLQNPGGQPVLMLHGIASNLNEFNIPGRAMASHLANLGYDVWCLNFRGAGRGRLASEGPEDHSFDDLVVLDLPAAVSKVERDTGRRPFLLGHSMGGMVALAWLQGAERKRVPVHGVRPFVIRGERIEADPAVAARRARRVRGLVAIGSPARFTWPAVGPIQLGGPGLAVAPYWDYNLVLTSMSWSPSANSAALLTPYLPAGRVLELLTDDLTGLPGIGSGVEDALQDATAALGGSFLVAQISKPGSVDDDVLYRGLDLAVDDTPVPVLRQFMDGIRHGDMRELHVLDTARDAYSYADGLRRVEAPVLWIAGRYDKLANEEAIATAVPRLGTSDKRFLATDHGHIDLVIGDTAPQDVWRPVVDWLRAR